MRKIDFGEALSEQFSLFFELMRWIPVSILVGIMAGSASALLLVSLEFATREREAHPWIIALLPVAGGIVGLLYKAYGASVEAGNNLILEQVHDPTATIPVRMTPLVLLGTFLTHLFGGSAGREGTAIQTGASLADQLARPLRMSPEDRRLLLMAGISAGFGSVFGTPMAGAVFGIEVLAIGRLSYDAIAPCFLAAFLGNLVTRAWGVKHTIYHVSEVPALTVERMVYVVLAGVAFGLCGMAFAKFTHTVSQTARRYIASAPMRPVAGGFILSALVFGFGYEHMRRYIGLGIPTIVSAFQIPLPRYDFAVKFILTGLTLGTGFKGGEVTPLFYIGSTLGNALSSVLPLPSSLLAAMGFTAVFAGAANTPIASTLMAVELFGSEAGAYAALACVVAYLCSGHAGIYASQRVGKSKRRGRAAEEGMSLALIAKLRNVSQDTAPDATDGSVYIGGIEMQELTVLRLYFSAAEMRKPMGWWQRFAPQGLGPYLLQRAKEHGIEQALLHRVIGGFLKNQELTLDSGEVPPARLPQCLELVGNEADLQAFLKQNRDHLLKVRPVFLKGREAEVEAAIEKEEIEEALQIERGEGQH